MDCAQPLVSRLIELCEVNSGTFNAKGVEAVAQRAAELLSQLGAEVTLEAVAPAERIGRDGRIEKLSLGPAVVAELPGVDAAGPPVLLNIHLDTVYPEDTEFRRVSWSDGRLVGPGVADAKGGLVVLLEGLGRARERGRCPPVVVVLNPDEEIGSPSSRQLLERHGRRCRCALVFEPTLPDGAFVSARKGSGTFTWVLRGRSAHAGRDFTCGRSALLAAARLALRLDALNARRESVIVNPGVLESGTAINLVPGLAVLRVNVRVSHADDLGWLEEALRAAEADLGDGITVERTGGLHSPPRVLDPQSQGLLELVLAQARSLALPDRHRATGGSCDGNRLAALGLAVVDSMGVTGGELHSPGEYVEPGSLEARAELLARVLARLAEAPACV